MPTSEIGCWLPNDPQHRTSRGRRGTPHQRLGPRLSPGLPPHRPECFELMPQKSPALHNCDRQRPRRRRHPSPTRLRIDGHARRISTARVCRCIRSRFRPSWNGLRGLVQEIPRTCPGSGIVYCLTVADIVRVADWLNANGITAAAYSGDTDSDRRLEIEKQLKANEVKVVAATSALGMGYDKVDLSFVIHYQSPDSPVAYYQQVGRAGRAIENAEVVLLWSERDEASGGTFSTPSCGLQWHAEQVVEYLESAADWVGQREIELHVNMPTSRITGLLKVLDVEGAVKKERAKFRRTLRPWSFDTERIERVKNARLAEHQAMRDYANTSECRMAFLRNSLDDRDVGPCGRCDNCAGRRYDRVTDSGLVGQALTFIRRRPIEIEPRKMWVGHRRGRISNLLEPGRALCFLTDPGWGDQLDAARQSGRAS